MEADLSEHLGRSGEFLIGLFGLLVLALMHKDVRRKTAAAAQRGFGLFAWLHRQTSRRSSFYANWARAFRYLFQDRRDLFSIVIALTALDYLSGWHANFFFRQFDLATAYESYQPADILLAYYSSAEFALSVLRIFGYALFGWLAFRVAAGASYREAVQFRPLRQLAGLFFCIYGAQVFTDTLMPLNLSAFNLLTEYMLFFAFTGAQMLIGAACMGLGAALLNKRNDGVRLKSAGAALLGYLLVTHLLQWLYFAMDWLAVPTRTVWLRVAEYYASNFTYTLLTNVLLTAFAIRLACPKGLSEPGSTAPDSVASDHAADAV
ncbi:hypothetical protein [Hyphococcus luteus]|uniref:Uncharacterized protein n=1 Tax=Hyphococcus luteus TaxID=2058213 RepID=A0A2S7K663_9PROT|nr:hypothetical protein [Marinicaulis flavus]PQA87993.1 hypothetical protein CW354_06565 [Marinicaulis flavus]